MKWSEAENIPPLNLKGMPRLFIKRVVSRASLPGTDAPVAVYNLYSGSEDGELVFQVLAVGHDNWMVERIGPGSERRDSKLFPSDKAAFAAIENGTV